MSGLEFLHAARDPELLRALSSALLPPPLEQAPLNPARGRPAAAHASDPREENRGAQTRQHLLDQMHLSHGLCDEQIIGQLRTVRWFQPLDMAQICKLYSRARHIFYAKYSVIVREGNPGSTFFVLIVGRAGRSLFGQDKATEHGSNYSFEEGALIKQVHRQATVVALEDCYLLQFTAADVKDLPIEKPQVRSLSRGSGAALNAAIGDRTGSDSSYDSDEDVDRKPTLNEVRWERLAIGALELEQTRLKRKYELIPDDNAFGASSSNNDTPMQSRDSSPQNSFRKGMSEGAKINQQRHRRSTATTTATAAAQAAGAYGGGGMVPRPPATPPPGTNGTPNAGRRQSAMGALPARRVSVGGQSMARRTSVANPRAMAALTQLAIRDALTEGMQPRIIQGQSLDEVIEEEEPPPSLPPSPAPIDPELPAAPSSMVGRRSSYLASGASPSPRRSREIED